MPDFYERDGEDSIFFDIDNPIISDSESIPIIFSLDFFDIQHMKISLLEE